MTLPWPLVGRADELDVVIEATGGASAAGIVVAGPPGVGKTRLAREAAAELENGSQSSGSPATPAAAAVPFGAVAYLLAAVDVDAAEDRLRLLRHATSAVVERGRAAALGRCCR